MSHEILVTGTEPGSGTGGVGSAVEAFLEALSESTWSHTFVPSYRPGTFLRRQLLFVRAAGHVVRETVGGDVAVVYAHAGGWLSMIRELCILILARASNAQTVMQIHSADLDILSLSIPGRALLRTIEVAVDRITVVSGYWSRLLSERLGIRCGTVRNALPYTILECATARWTASITEERPLSVLTMTRLVERKGVESVLRAVERTQDVDLVVAGDGPEREHLQELASSLDLHGRVQFTGWVEGRRKKDLLREADVFCLPSRYESFGMGYLEAMAFGLPVVALDLPQIRELFGEVEGVLLVDSEETRSVTDAIDSLRGADRRNALAQSVREHVRRYYSPAALCGEIEDLVASVVGHRES